jgi:hypothetical protein
VAVKIAILGYLQRKLDKVRALHDELACSLIKAMPIRRGGDFGGSLTLQSRRCSQCGCFPHPLLRQPEQHFATLGIISSCSGFDTTHCMILIQFG